VVSRVLSYVIPNILLNNINILLKINSILNKMENNQEIRIITSERGGNLIVFNNHKHVLLDAEKTILRSGHAPITNAQQVC